MRSSRRAPTLTATAILLAGALLMAACGGDGDAADASADTDEATSTRESVTETEPATAEAVSETESTATTELVTPTTEPDGTFSPAVSELIEQARDESGKVIVFVGSGGFEADQLAAINAALTDYYGFTLEIEGGPVSAHPAFMQQLIDEASQGVPPSVDVVVSVSSLLPMLEENDILADVDFTSLGADPSLVHDAFPGVRVHDQLRGIVYNPDLVDEADVPTAYEDLLDPKWKGKICAPGFAALFVAFVPLMGHEAALEYARALVEDQDMTLVATITDAPARVASGECAVALGADSGSLGRQGAPVVDATLDEVIASGFWAVPTAESGRLARAALVSYFLATDAGQALLDDLLAWGRFDSPGTNASTGIKDGSEPTFLTLEFLTEERPELLPEFSEVLGLL